MEKETNQPDTGEEKQPIEVNLDDMEGMEDMDIEIEDVPDTPQAMVMDISGVMSMIGLENTHFIAAALEFEPIDPKLKLLQAFRVGRRYHEDKNTGRRTLISRGHKKGSFVAVPDPEQPDKLLIGFSLCHRRDRFDFNGRMKLKGLGNWYAYEKAKKYAHSDRFVIATDSTAKNLPRPIVKIPQSMAKDLARFIVRCRKFFKGKDFPDWTTNFALEQLPKLGETLSIEGPKDETGTQENAG